MLVDDFDLTYIQQQFHDQLDGMLHSVLNQHGVFIQDNTSFEMMNVILEGISSVESYIDREAILTIISTENTDEEKLADILDLVTIIDSDSILLTLERVNPSIIRRIKELVEEHKAIADVISNTEITQIKAKAAWVKRLYELSGPEVKDCSNSVLYPKLTEGLRLNLSFQFYYDMLWDEISQSTNAGIARELVGMAIISNDQSERVLEVIREYVGKNFYDLDQIGRINDIAMRQFLVSKQDNGVKLEV